MIASGYTMDLYCRHTHLPQASRWDGPTPKGHHEYDEFPHQILGETFAGCKRHAAAQGWKFHRDGDVSCPRCNGR